MARSCLNLSRAGSKMHASSNLFASHYELAKAVGKHREIDDVKTE